MTATLAFGVMFATGCGNGTTPAGDAGDARAADAPTDVGAPTDAPPRGDVAMACSTDRDCDDGLYCNGAERCTPGAAGADARGCTSASAPPCTADQTCDEAHGTCTSAGCANPDMDGDGHRAIACGGDDCDDTDAHRYPGNTEVCAVAMVAAGGDGGAGDGSAGDGGSGASLSRTAMGLDPTHDEDCDPTTFANAATHDGDHDGDGFVDVACSNTDRSGMSSHGSDCDDLDVMHGVQPGDVHPMQPEGCNGVDDNCNGMVDEGDPGGGGTCGTGMSGACAPGVNHCVAGGLTCQPTHTAGTETCNGIDDDCNGTVDDLPAISCGLPGSQCFNMVAACSAGLPQTCTPHPSMPEICNGLDDDCNGTVDNGWPRSCYSGAAGTAGVGPCHTGTQSCTSGTLSACVGEVTPLAADTCAVPDGNCNGRAYEGLECAGGTTRPCCGIGTQSCNASTCTWSACPPTGYTQTWAAADPPNSHGANCGMVGNTGHNWELVPGSPTPGCHMTDGPGISLPPGNYRLTIDAYCWTDNGAGPCYMQWTIPFTSPQMWGSAMGTATHEFGNSSNFTVPAGSCQSVNVTVEWAAGHINYNSLTITAL